MTNVNTDQGTTCSLFGCVMIMSYTFCLLRIWGPRRNGPVVNQPLVLFQEERIRNCKTTIGSYEPKFIGHILTIFCNNNRPALVIYFIRNKHRTNTYIRRCDELLLFEGACLIAYGGKDTLNLHDRTYC